MDLDLFVGGLTAGSLYALVAMGFNILYRPTNVFNFAQGDLVMLGAMLGATVMTMLGMPWFVGAVAAILGGVGDRVGDEEVAVRSAGEVPLGTEPVGGDRRISDRRLAVGEIGDGIDAADRQPGEFVGHDPLGGPRARDATGRPQDQGQSPREGHNPDDFAPPLVYFLPSSRHS